jgi:hypothetical protein
MIARMYMGELRAESFSMCVMQLNVLLTSLGILVVPVQYLCFPGPHILNIPLHRLDRLFSIRRPTTDSLPRGGQTSASEAFQVRLHDQQESFYIRSRRFLSATLRSAIVCIVRGSGR